MCAQLGERLRPIGAGKGRGDAVVDAGCRGLAFGLPPQLHEFERQCVVALVSSRMTLGMAEAARCSTMRSSPSRRR
jgi:hypothetical protein